MAWDRVRGVWIPDPDPESLAKKLSSPPTAAAAANNPSFPPASAPPRRTAEPPPTAAATARPLRLPRDGGDATARGASAIVRAAGALRKGEEAGGAAKKAGEKARAATKGMRKRRVGDEGEGERSERIEASRGERTMEAARGGAADVGAREPPTPERRRALAASLRAPSERMAERSPRVSSEDERLKLRGAARGERSARGERRTGKAAKGGEGGAGSREPSALGERCGTGPSAAPARLEHAAERSLQRRAAQVLILRRLEEGKDANATGGLTPVAAAIVATEKKEEEEGPKRAGGAFPRPRGRARIGWFRDSFGDAWVSDPDWKAKEEMGPFPRPRGRAKIGCVWDSFGGSWVSDPDWKAKELALELRRAELQAAVAAANGRLQGERADAEAPPQGEEAKARETVAVLGKRVVLQADAEAVRKARESASASADLIGGRGGELRAAVDAASEGPRRERAPALARQEEEVDEERVPGGKRALPWEAFEMANDGPRREGTSAAKAPSEEEAGDLVGGKSAALRAAARKARESAAEEDRGGKRGRKSGRPRKRTKGSEPEGEEEGPPGTSRRSKRLRGAAGEGGEEEAPPGAREERAKKSAPGADGRSGDKNWTKSIKWKLVPPGLSSRTMDEAAADAHRGPTVVATAEQFDVVFAGGGGGGLSPSHRKNAGHWNLLSLVRFQRERFACASATVRRLIAGNVVKAMVEWSPDRPFKGRFLAPTEGRGMEGLWVELGRKDAVKRVQRAMAEGAYDEELSRLGGGEGGGGGGDKKGKDKADAVPPGVVTAPRPQDVFFLHGSGGGSLRLPAFHPGNVRLTQILRDHRRRYGALSTNGNPLLVRGIVAEVRRGGGGEGRGEGNCDGGGRNDGTKDPTERGRFLVPFSGGARGWVEAGDERAWEEVGRMLRELPDGANNGGAAGGSAEAEAGADAGDEMETSGREGGLHAPEEEGADAAGAPRRGPAGEKPDASGRTTHAAAMVAATTAAREAAAKGAEEAGTTTAMAGPASARMTTPTTMMPPPPKKKKRPPAPWQSKVVGPWMRSAATTDGGLPPEVVEQLAFRARLRAIRKGPRVRRSRKRTKEKEKRPRGRPPKVHRPHGWPQGTKNRAAVRKGASPTVAAAVAATATAAPTPILTPTPTATPTATAAIAAASGGGCAQYESWQRRRGEG